MQTLIIPGFQENGKEKPYKEIAKIDSRNTSIINMRWKNRVMSDYIKEVEEYILKNNFEINSLTVIGFSFGAFIAIQLAAKYGFKKVVSCSCSPYFKENLPYLPDSAVKFIGKRRIEDFKKYQIQSLKSFQTKKVFFLFGEKDWSMGVRASQKIAKKINAPFILIKDTDHELTDSYLDEIIKIV